MRFWTKRLTKQDTFAVPFADVQALLSNEQTRVVPDPPHEDLLAAAVAADRRRDALRPILRRARAALLVLEGWNLGVVGAAVIGMSSVTAIAAASGFSSAVWLAVLGQVAVPIWCVRVWTVRT